MSGSQRLAPRISSSTGSRYVRKRCGCSLIGAHRKVTELLHDRDAGARDPRRGLARVVGGAREVVLARQEIKGAARRVDAADAVPKVALGPVEVEVAAKDARSALGVQPERLPPGLGRRLRRDEP